MSIWWYERRNPPDTGPHSKPLQTDERRVTVSDDRNVPFAPLAAERQAVRHRRRLSFAERMLFEILEHPGVVSRRSHVSFYRNTLRGFGDACFDNVIGSKGKCLSQKQIRSDLRSIEDASLRLQSNGYSR